MKILLLNLGYLWQICINRSYNFWTDEWMPRTNVWMDKIVTAADMRRIKITVYNTNRNKYSCSNLDRHRHTCDFCFVCLTFHQIIPSVCPKPSFRCEIPPIRSPCLLLRFPKVPFPLITWQDSQSNTVLNTCRYYSNRPKPAFRTCWLLSVGLRIIRKYSYKCAFSLEKLPNYH